MVLVDSTYNSGKNEVLFVKIEDRVPDYGFISLSDPSDPNLVSTLLGLSYGPFPIEFTKTFS